MLIIVQVRVVMNYALSIERKRPLPLSQETQRPRIKRAEIIIRPWNSHVAITGQAGEVPK